VSAEKSLTARQAASCENAKGPPSACKCRCGGAAHGKQRGVVRDLPAADPHHPDDEAPKTRRKRLAVEAWLKRLAALRAGGADGK